MGQVNRATLADDIYYFVNEMQKWRVLYLYICRRGTLPTQCAVSASFQTKSQVAIFSMPMTINCYIPISELG